MNIIRKSVFVGERYYKEDYVVDVVFMWLCDKVWFGVIIIINNLIFYKKYYGNFKKRVMYIIFRLV